MRNEKLLSFLQSEFQAEEQSGFARLRRIPDSYVATKLRHYNSLSNEEKEAFRECCALWAYAAYSFVVSAPRLDHTQHPHFREWCRPRSPLLDSATPEDVPLLRAMVQQYKMDKRRGVPSSVTEEQFAYASSIRSVKAPELRRRVRAALKPLGYKRLDNLGFYNCTHSGREFKVHVDFGGSHAQLRYVVSLSEFKDVHPLSQFGFERTLGMGFGDWDFIVEENVDDVFDLFKEVVAYCSELPDRIREKVR